MESKFVCVLCGAGMGEDDVGCAACAAFLCVLCEEWRKPDMVVGDPEARWCSDCSGPCVACGEFYTFDNGPGCSCFECDRCDRWCHEDDYGGDGYCITCYNEHSDRCVCDACLEDGRFWTGGFQYRPMFVSFKRGGVEKVLRIPQGLQDEMRSEVEVVFIAREPLAVLRVPLAEEVFEHYHSQCWGAAERWRKDGEDWSDVAKRLETVLEVIDGESLALSYPEGLPPFSVVLEAAIELDAEVGWRAAQETEAPTQLLRQQELGLRVPNAVIIVGCGGVGWNLATMLARAGVRRIMLCDPDLLEAHNLNRIPQPRRTLGLLKTRALGAVLTELGVDHAFSIPYQIETVNERAYDRPYGWDVWDVIADCTDNIETQRFTHQLAAEKGWRYVRAGNDGWLVTVTSQAPPGWGNMGAGYTVPSWVVGAEMAAALACTKICFDPDLEFSKDIRVVWRTDVGASQALPGTVIVSRELEPLPRCIRQQQVMTEA